MIEVKTCSNTVLGREAAEFVCSNFDITLCCVTATVQDDLTLTFRGFDGALEALDMRTIILRATAFGSHWNPVPTQMRRLV